MELDGTVVFFSAAVAISRIRPLTQDGVLVVAFITLEQTSTNSYLLSVRNGFKLGPTAPARGPGVTIGDHGPPHTKFSMALTTVTLKLAESLSSCHLL